MTRPPAWQQEEYRIYLRDGFFLVLTIFFSVILAELLIIKGRPSPAVDRIFTYLLVFIPLGTFNFIAHYYYRNRRIRRTGNLRSSFRYQLTIAFMLVAVIPSIPIFLLSSNTMERIVEGIFRLDVARAMNSAHTLLEFYEKQELKEFRTRLKLYDANLFRYEKANPELLSRLYSDGVLETGRDYAGLLKKREMIYETKPLFSSGRLPKFTTARDGSGFARLDLKKMSIHLYRFQLRDRETYLILGHRLYPEMEKDHKRFSSVYDRLQKEALWTVEIPTKLRLGLGIIYIVMITMVIIVSMVISRQISLPIVSIAAAARDIADGKLNTRLHIRASGEMGVLIDSFNQMVSELRTLRTRLLHTQRVAAWQEVARRLAHEIKNPLTPIQLSAERILRRLEKPNPGDLTRVLRTGANTIIDQVNHMKTMLDEFSDFARLPEAKPVRANLDKIVAECIHIFRGIPDISMEMVLSGELPYLLLDKNLIIGMINNLMKNGVEAIHSAREEGTEFKNGRLRITTQFKREGNRHYVLLRVEDSGPGIPEKIQDKIFEPYFTTKGKHGSGLGLAIVERAVAEHEARIQVGRSAALGGAEFVISFRVPQEEGS